MGCFSLGCLVESVFQQKMRFGRIRHRDRAAKPAAGRYADMPRENVKSLFARIYGNFANVYENSISTAKIGVKSNFLNNERPKKGYVSNIVSMR